MNSVDAGKIPYNWLDSQRALILVVLEGTGTDLVRADWMFVSYESELPVSWVVPGGYTWTTCRPGKEPRASPVAGEEGTWNPE